MTRVITGLKRVGRFLWNAGAFLFYGYVLLTLPMYLFEWAPEDEPKSASNLLGLCRTAITRVVESPDKRYVAQLGSVDCGAFTRTQGGVNVFDREENVVHRGLLNFRGARDEGVAIDWEGNRTIVATGLKLENVTGLSALHPSGITVVLKETKSP